MEFFLQGVGGQTSCGKLVNVAALQFVTLLTMKDFNLFWFICGYGALSWCRREVICKGRVIVGVPPFVLLFPLP